ncbi:glycosyltransferase family 4 protein [Vibrio vulnificus]|uniref:glycosyltransferase family 4 protein n=1 Tax=Vibrio vulnificus TaxID=672 RepID=UPI00307D4A56
MNKKNSLVYILNSYSENESSHFYHILNLLNCIAKKNVDITLVIEKCDGEPILDDRVKLIKINKKGLMRYVLLFKILRGIAKEKKSAIYVRISSVTALVAKFSSFFTKSKLYFWQSGTTHEWDWEQPFNFKKIKWMVKSYFPSYMARKMVDYFVTGPEYMVGYYSDVVGITKNKIKLLYNDIDVNRFSLNELETIEFRNKLEADYPILVGRRIALMVHRMSPVRKTTMYIPEALLASYQAYEDVVFIFAGGGSEVPEIMSSVNKYGIQDRVIFLGDFPNEKIQYLYAISNVFLHPTYNEGFPRVILESMAAGLPFVSTDAGGVFDIIPNEMREYVSDKNDIESFSNNLVRILSSEVAINYLSGSCKKQAIKFDTDKIANMYINVLFEEKA